MATSDFFIMSLDERISRDTFSMFVPGWGQYRILKGENRDWRDHNVLGLVACTHLHLVEGLLLYAWGRGLYQYLQ